MQIDIGKAPRQLLLELVRSQNPNIPEGNAAQFIFRNIATIDTGGRNTSIEMTHNIVGSPIVADFVTINYSRVPLAGLFQLIVEAEMNIVHEMALTVDEDGIVTDGFLEYLETKFGFKLVGMGGFRVDARWGVVTLVAETDNVAYTGSVSFKVTPRLTRRVKLTTLKGFTKLHSELYTVATIRPIISIASARHVRTLHVHEVTV